MIGTRDPLKLVGVLARRGEEDLRALAGVIRGEQLDSEQHDRLRHAGLLRAGPAAKLPASLIAPVLALEAALGMRGAGPMAALVRLLRGAEDEPERSTLLGALADQLAEHLAALDQAPAPEGLRDVLDDLRLTVEQLTEADADPAEVTRVSALCARLIERLADSISPRHTTRSPSLTAEDPARLAAAVRDQVHTRCQPLQLPAASALARALVGPEALPRASARRPQLGAHPRTRRDDVLVALRSADPVSALYAGRDPKEALRRHSALIGAGSEALQESGKLLCADRRIGPAPLAWSTAILAEAQIDMQAA